MNDSLCINFTLRRHDEELINPDHPVLDFLKAISALITSFIVTANTVVITAMLRSKSEGSKPVDTNCRLTRLLMTSLAFSDLLIGVFVMPLETVELFYNGKWKLGSILCALKIPVHNYLCIVCLLHICCLSVDRFLAVCKPLVYRQLSLTTGHVMIAFSWGVPVLFVLLPEIISAKNHFLVDTEECTLYHLNCHPNKVLILIFFICFYVPFVVTFALYFVILREVHLFFKRKAEFLKKSGHSRTRLPGSTATGNFLRGLAVDAKFRKDFSICSSRLNVEHVEHLATFQDLSTNFCDRASKLQGIPDCSIPTPANGNERVFPKPRNLKAYKTIGSILVCFTMCYMPTWVTMAVVVATGCRMPLWLYWFLGLVAFLSSALNPLLYCLTRSIRRAVLSLVWSKYF